MLPLWEIGMEAGRVVAGLLGAAAALLLRKVLAR